MPLRQWESAYACGVDERFLQITLQATGLVLRFNYFEFNGHIYKQVKGLAMGTPLAPPVAICSWQAKRPV